MAVSVSNVSLSHNSFIAQFILAGSNPNLAARATRLFRLPKNRQKYSRVIFDSGLFRWIFFQRYSEGWQIVWNGKFTGSSERQVKIDLEISRWRYRSLTNGIQPILARRLARVGCIMLSRWLRWIKDEDDCYAVVNYSTTFNNAYGPGLFPFASLPLERAPVLSDRWTVIFNHYSTFKVTTFYSAYLSDEYLGTFERLRLWTG